MPRTKRIIITLSPEEYEEIKRASIAQGRTVSAFLRHHGLNESRREKKEEVEK